MTSPRRSLGLALLVLAALGSIAAGSDPKATAAPAGDAKAPSDWPKFRGPRHDGISNETGIAKSWPEGGPKQLWRKPLGEGFSAVSVVGDRLYTMYATGKDEVVAALDAGSGKELWRVRVDEKWVDEMGNGPRSTPTVDGDTVFALSARGTLVALAAKDGALRWKSDLRSVYGTKPPRWGMSTSPLVEGDLLLVDVGGKSGSSIVAFDKTSGKEAWRSQDDKPGYSVPLPVTVSGLRLVVFFTGSRLVGLDPEDGSRHFEVPWTTSYDVNAAAPVFVPPDKLFVSSGYDVGAALYRIEVAEGRASVVELWKNREMKNQFSSSVYRDGHLYGFDDGTLKCLDVATGKTVWAERGFGHGSLIWADGHLVVLGDDGILALVEATPAGYRERGRARPFDGKTWTVPTLAGGRLFLRDEHELVSLDVSG
jgi:outer membrane protein assembly factor BamB